MNRIKPIVIALLVMIALAGMMPQQSLANWEKVDPRLLRALETEEVIRFHVVMSEQADVSGAAVLATKDERTAYVYNVLVETANRTQAGILQHLQAEGVTYRSFYIYNAIEVTGGRTVLEWLAARADVARIVTAPNPQPEPVSQEPTLAEYTVVEPETGRGEAIEWNVTRIGAPDVWAMGFDGTGMVVGDNDTGAQYNHPALVNQYRGNLGGGSFDHNYNWWDDWGGAPSPFPMDYDGHGTHTMGTMIGDDGGSNQIGVAPGAEWMACAGMSLGCFQFFLTPTDLDGLNPDPTKAPDAINNSWYDPSGYDYRTIIQNLNAAGIAVIKSAGNQGSGCSTITNPGYVPEIIATAAFNSSDVIASFSSRGPSSYYGPVILKPEVAAPGVSVRSSYPTNTYSFLSGTSMAAPHTTALITLIWQAAPCLQGDVPTTKDIIMWSAESKIDAQCGPFVDHPNDVWGWGILDAEAAVNAAILHCSADNGYLDGHVYEADGVTPIEGATVMAVLAPEGAQIEAITDPSGYYTMTLAAGTYDVTASKIYYTPQTVTGVVITTGATTTQDFLLTPLAGYLNGHVYEADGVTPIEGATVDAVLGLDNSIQAITDPNGYYTMTLEAGTYDVTASMVGYASQTVAGVVVTTGGTTVQDFALTYLGQWTMDDTIQDCWNLTRVDARFYAGTGLVYVLGGRSGADTVGNIYAMDLAAGTCTDTGAVMPTPISNYTINIVNDGTDDLLCTFGGRDSAGATTLDVQCYNPATNTAAVVAQLPAAWTGYTPGAQVVYNNQVYIFGGFNSTTAPYMTARTERYDPETTAFTQIGDLNLARAYIMAAVVDGAIYAFGGDTFDGASLIAQSIAEVMADPEGAATWDDAAVADLPVAGDEGRAFGFDSDAPYAYANQIVIATLAQWSGDSAAVILYDIATDTYDQDFPDLNVARRNHGGTFVPLDTPDPMDGLPGLWVFGGRSGSDTPPYPEAEFFPVAGSIVENFFTYLPVAFK